MMIFIKIMLASLLSCLGQLCQKQAAHPPLHARPGRHLVLWMGLALVCLGLGLVMWLWVLQHVSVGIAYPMLSLNFVWVTLAARWIWKESVDRRHWLGIGCILLGIILLGETS